MLFAVPLSVAGLGFIHARAAHRKLGAGWLSVFYLLWLLLDPVFKTGKKLGENCRELFQIDRAKQQHGQSSAGSYQRGR